MVKAFIQARMSSSRFPGKVLAPFKGEPVILHVLRQISKVMPMDEIIVMTSTEVSDDPLCFYLEEQGINVFRGDLNNVFLRFKMCLEKYPCDNILRICADSPLLDADVLKKVIDYAYKGDKGFDIVTTTFPRTFPKGYNAELIKSSVLKSIDESKLTPYELEHVTLFFYNNPDKFNIYNVESDNPELSKLNYAVDTVEDLKRLESIFEEAKK
ncbi:MAG: NTP transferase domain-containing protein [Armatimonadota bacterium]